MTAMSGRHCSRALKGSSRTLADVKSRIMFEHDRHERAPMKHYFPDEDTRGGAVDDARAESTSKKAKSQKKARSNRRRRPCTTGRSGESHDAKHSDSRQKKP